MKFTLTWCTNYNGVYLNTHNDEGEVKVSAEIVKVFDLVADTFPTFTFHWSEKFDPTITSEQEQQLCDMATTLLRPFDPTATVKFEYDSSST